MVNKFATSSIQNLRAWEYNEDLEHIAIREEYLFPGWFFVSTPVGDIYLDYGDLIVEVGEFYYVIKVNGDKPTDTSKTELEQAGGCPVHIFGCPRPKSS